MGVPAELFTDGAPLLTGPQSEFVRIARHLRIKLGSVEPHTQKKNKVEKAIGILKRRWKNRMSLTGMSKRLWPFVLTYEARITSMCARGRDGILRTGSLATISDATISQLILYRSTNTPFPLSKWGPIDNRRISSSLRRVDHS